MKKKIIGSIIVVLIIGFGVFLYGGWKMFGDELKAIKSLTMVGEGVYTFTFKGDYGFKAFLEKGGAKTDAEMARYIAEFLSHGYMNIPAPESSETKTGCTSFQGVGLFARNFDFEPKGQQIVLVRTEPTDGYRSVSTSTFAFLGMGDDWHPVAGMDGFAALATVYIPLDGMNEKGVCVADLVEIDGDSIATDTEKPDLTIVAAIRLVLDYAASVDEAVELLSRYDIHPSIGTAHHLAIADERRSVVVEWKDGQQHVTDTTVVTNHCLYQKRENALTEESKHRLERVGVHKPASIDGAMAAIKDAAYPEQTLWSVIYDRKAKKGVWYCQCNWDKSFELTITE